MSRVSKAARAPRASRERKAVLDELARSAQRAATDGILFHQAVADRLGLHVSDLRCLTILAQTGPVPAGEIVRRTGLTTGAVTRLVDRLERAGYVERRPDPADRRRVSVVPVPEQFARIGPMYAGMARGWAASMADYDDEQLRTFVGLFDRIHEITQAEIARLRA